MAASLSIGDLEFADYPVQVLENAKSTDYDGLIGADVFQLFRVSIDFQHLRLILGAYPDGPTSADAPVDAPDAVPDGFCPMLRFGHGLTVCTSVNEGPARLFLVDSGSSVDLVDTAIARESTRVGVDEGPGLSGIQGRVEKLWRARRITLLFAGLRHENPNLLAASLDGLGDASGVGIAGLLGMPVLWDMKVTIDYRNGAMRFEKQDGIELSMR
jgi:hypothetical protein